MDLAKIQLSKEELLLVQNAELLLTKNRIIGKVYEMFGVLAGDIQKLFSPHSILLEEILQSPPKISKGENYKGLPYVMLDYPRKFTKTDTFAIRTMFWWGNFFSTTLHLKGKYKDAIVPVLKDKLSLLAGHHFFMNIESEEWRHDFEADNYLPILHADRTTVVNNLIKKDFCKIAGKISLDGWNDAPVKLLKFYEMIVEVTQINYQVDGRDL